VLKHYLCRVFITVMFPPANNMFHYIKSNTTYISSATWLFNAIARGSVQCRKQRL